MLAKRNNLTKATVTAICDELSALNLLREVGQHRNSIGWPAGSLVSCKAARPKNCMTVASSTKPQWRPIRWRWMCSEASPR